MNVMIYMNINNNIYVIMNVMIKIEGKGLYVFKWMN